MRAVRGPTRGPAPLRARTAGCTHSAEYDAAGLDELVAALRIVHPDPEALTERILGLLALHGLVPPGPEIPGAAGR